MKKTALVIGATGVSGRALLDELETRAEWNVYAASRSVPDWTTRARHVAVDLSDAAKAHEALATFTDVTHVFHCAYVDRPSWIDQAAPNAALLRNAVEALEPVAKDLAHVCLLQGTKYYGAHLGAFRTPAKEHHDRAFPPNFYYLQQDFLTERQKGKAWTWSCARPHTICGFALGNPLNLISVLGVYATISRHFGLPLRYPGSPVGFGKIYQVSDAGLLARAMLWMATEPRCANQAFNITNGDYVRFENLWPVFADYFGMAAGRVHQVDLKLMMSDKEPVWNDLVARHDLAPNPFARVADWNYANYAFRFDWDIMSDTLKARLHGFHECMDTEGMFIRLFDRLREQRVIP
jgi:nucleoside-diphosphate-sugar epimerase